MRYFFYIVFIICFFSCKKNLTVLSNSLVNFSPDSLYVTVTNLSHGQFSIPKTGLAPWTSPPSGNNSVELKAVDGDDLSIQCIVKSVNKKAKHPLFIKEFTYTYSDKAPYRGTIIGINSPVIPNLIPIMTRNPTNSYVTAMLVYNGKEDSLFTLEPLLGSTGTSLIRIGYINAADTTLIKNPLAKFYIGQNPPFTTSISTFPLWGAGASYSTSSSEPYTTSNVVTGYSTITIPIKQ